MRTLKGFTLSLVFAVLAFGQVNSLSSTTLTTAITDSSVNWVVASTASMVAPTLGQNGSQLFIEQEPVLVASIQDSTHVTVKRIQRPVAHKAGLAIWLGLPPLFQATDPTGACVKASVYVDPWINVNNGVVWRCGAAGYWGRNDGLAPYTRTAVADVAYTAVYSDYIIAYSSLTTSGKAVTLPAAATMPNHCIIVKDEAGGATSYNLTFTNTIEGGSACTSTNYGTCKVCSNGTAWARY